ncbi:MAG: DEAD/DEAH box helicase family protein [Candidatus Electrothrix communis]|nr:MAG: DEAD/DEAH box helicase family protein [Candidatus Electrothrix communis]
MTNFAFLPTEFRTIAESATQAEGHIMGDPRAACFHARFTLEAIVHWLYRHDSSLTQPYARNLGALLFEATFQDLLPQAVLHKAQLIHKLGNAAVHTPRPVPSSDALQAVKDLHHFCHWLVRTYSPPAVPKTSGWRDDLVPSALDMDSAAVVPRKELESLEGKLAAQNEKSLKQQQERDALDAEIQALREQLTALRAQSEQQIDPHDYSEAETRHALIDVDLHRAGWPLADPQDREYQLSNMPTSINTGTGIGYADYVLWGDDGRPLAVVEAKKSTADPQAGQQQAKLYADCLEQMHGQRPLIFFTNGYSTWLWDDTSYPPRQVAGFYSKDELTRLILRRNRCTPLKLIKVKEAIAGRYYQIRAIRSIADQFTEARRKALLVMATGTGKTRTAIALVDLLQRAGWVKRALFLADRISLVNQACNAFKEHLPDSSPVNLVTEKGTEGRVAICTYPTMMGLIDKTIQGTTNEGKGTAARQSSFGVGHFDLIIIDEAHRSVYRKYGAIFRYFDALLVGLTATPREEVDKNTYDLFELEPGVPTDAYELAEGVKDGFLVPPRVAQVDMRFPGQGIDYDLLSAEEQAQWEELDWGDDGEPDRFPDKVNAAAINNWLFNQDTVDKVLKYLMEHGHRVEGGDRLAKTIIFARNHEHALFIEERFNRHYPQYAGHFGRVIDNYVKHAQSLIEDFGQQDKAPHIAISVDMLDTGIDVPAVANLVFFKPVFSKIKFWQMIGRGTRPCPDLFGPGEDKPDFRVFDFCFNFDFFQENPEGINAGDTAPLGIRLFQARVQLLSHIQSRPETDPDAQLATSLTDGLYREVKAMHRDNFIVRMHRQAVEQFQERTAWDQLSESDCMTLQREVAGLPSELASDNIKARLFDLTALRMQLALIEGGSLERQRRRVMEIAQLLEEKRAVPAVAAQLAYLAGVQEDSFWQGMTLAELEDLRLRFRELVPLLDKQERNLVYTDFQDEVLGVREEEPVYIPRMTGTQYEKKVKDYLRCHTNQLVIQRLKANEPLTALDLQGLENVLAKIGADEGKMLLSDLLKRNKTPSLAHFIRSLVGLDRAAAKAAFARFLNDRSLTAPQIRFIELIIDQLTARGIMNAEALYHPPFTNLHSGGPEGVFAGKENLIKAVFTTLESLQPRVQGMIQERVG